MNIKTVKLGPIINDYAAMKAAILDQLLELLQQSMKTNIEIIAGVRALVLLEGLYGYDHSSKQIVLAQSTIKLRRGVNLSTWDILYKELKLAEE